MERREQDGPMRKAKELSQFTAAKTDPMGSWTGRPLDPYEVPVQDVDKEEHIMTRNIDIKSEEQITRINRLACEAPYEVWLSTETMMLDARSLLSLYALVGQRAKVVTEDSVDPRSVDRLVEKMS